jgi:hypothetical protein
MTTVNNSSLTVSGLQINYTVDGQTTNLRLCPFATCSLLEELAVIEGFDASGPEPVILFQTSFTSYDGQQWNDFVKSFQFSPLFAEMVAGYNEGKKLISAMLKCFDQSLKEVRAAA